MKHGAFRGFSRNFLTQRFEQFVAYYRVALREFAVASHAQVGQGVLAIFNLDAATFECDKWGYYDRESYSRTMAADAMPQELFDESFWAYDPTQCFRVVIFSDAEESLENRFDFLVGLEQELPASPLGTGVAPNRKKPSRLLPPEYRTLLQTGRRKVTLQSWCHFVHSLAVETDRVNAGKPPLDFLDHYARVNAALSNELANYRGVALAVDADLTARVSERLKLSLVLADFTSVYPIPGPKQLIHVTFGPTFGPDSVTVPAEFCEGLLLQDGKPVIAPAYISPPTHRVRRFLRAVEPLVESGRLMYRPLPAVAGIMAGPPEDPIRGWKFYPVHTDLPGQHWVSQVGISPQGALPLVSRPVSEGRTLQLTRVFIPYLESASPTEIARALDSEADVLAEFRSSVKVLLGEVSSEPEMATEIYNDIVRPKTDAVERKFKLLVGKRRRQIAGLATTVATVSLCAWLGAPTLGTVTGVGGLVAEAIASIDRQNALAELRSMPFYLLWRIQRRSSPDAGPIGRLRGQ